MIRRLVALFGSSLAFWVIVAVPARLAWGDSALAYSAVAMALCLIPAAMTLAVATWAAGQSSDRQMTAILGGTVFRLVAVLAGAYLLTQWVPYFRENKSPGFLMYVGAFYLVTLALETGLAVSGRAGVKDELLPSGNSESVGRVG